MSMAEKNALAKNAMQTLKDLDAGNMSELSERDQKQLQSSIFTTLWALVTTSPSGSAMSNTIHNALVGLAENTSDKFFGRAMAKNLLRDEYTAKIGAAETAELKELFGAKFGEKFEVKNILDSEGYIEWEHACGHGEGFYKSFIKAIQEKKLDGASFVKKSSSWGSTEFELTFDPPKTTSDGTQVKGMRLTVRNFNDDMFDAVGQKKGFSYGGHSGIGSNQENSIKNAIMEGLQAYPREWLLRAELYDWAQRSDAVALARRLHTELHTLAQYPELTELIQLALQPSSSPIAA